MSLVFDPSCLLPQGLIHTSVNNSVPPGWCKPFPAPGLATFQRIHLWSSCRGLSNAEKTELLSSKSLSLWWPLFWPKSQDIIDHQVRIYCLNKIDKMFKTRQFSKFRIYGYYFCSGEKENSRCEKLKALSSGHSDNPSHEMFLAWLLFVASSQQLGLTWHGKDTVFFNRPRTGLCFKSIVFQGVV